MPELPEIETIKNDLAPHVVGKTIINITFPPDFKMRILRRVPSQDAFLAALRGVRVHTIKRRAKYLLLELDSSQTLIMHLGMSGQLLLRSGHAPMEPYVRAILHFGNKTELRFNDPRKFGELFLHLPSSGTASLSLDRLGPEPLEQEFSVAYLTHRLRGSRRKIKTFLLDQTAIAGLGNIYSDESLFSAKIHP
ncbi:MAG: hypothetical protein JXD19_05000, partial [Deltaproteobacteria bacterium]|nr:hypothetical protein [Deltaproteobacteria bacterium]